MPRARSAPIPCHPKTNPNPMQSETYRVGSILSTVEMNHAIDTGERRATTLVTVGVKLLLSEDITTVLAKYGVSKNSPGVCAWIPAASLPLTSHEKDTILTVKKRVGTRYVMRRRRISNVEYRYQTKSRVERRMNATIKAVDAREGKQVRRWKRRRLSLADGQTFSACTRCAQFQPFAISLNFFFFFSFFARRNLGKRRRAGPR